MAIQYNIADLLAEIERLNDVIDEKNVDISILESKLVQAQQAISREISECTALVRVKQPEPAYISDTQPNEDELHLVEPTPESQVVAMHIRGLAPIALIDAAVWNEAMMRRISS